LTAVDEQGPLPSIEELDQATAPRFREILTPLFESAPRFLQRLQSVRPFGSWDALFAEAERTALELPEALQVELLDAHPRIGADPGTVSTFSYAEQGYDRDAAATSDVAVASAAAEARRVAAELERLNDAYEARFGFRYVIFVAGRPRSAIVPLLDAALAADRAEELTRGLRDVVAIGRARAARLGIAGEEDRA
jgi:2-oxo-4-hydroxy-4-carboxy--5-ureidoimidazoline (OHCU) decarboxylase